VTLTDPGSAHQPSESVEVAVDIETGHNILLGHVGTNRDCDRWCSTTYCLTRVFVKAEVTE